MNIRKNIFLALTSGLLLGLPWSVSPLFFLIFFAWVPLLLLEREVRHAENPYAVFNYAFAGFLLWNIIGTWWIARAQFVGAIFIILANSLLQALAFWLASRILIDRHNKLRTAHASHVLHCSGYAACNVKLG